MTKPGWVLLPLAVAACATPEPLPEGLEFAVEDAGVTDGTIIDTVPSGALLTHPEGACRTPCMVAYGDRVVVTLAREGFRALRVSVPVGAADTAIELEPVGRSTAVEEVSLPEL